MCPQCKRRFKYIDPMKHDGKTWVRRGRRVRCRRVDQGDSTSPPPSPPSPSSPLIPHFLHLAHLLLPNRFDQFLSEIAAASLSSDVDVSVDGSGTSADPFVVLDDEDDDDDDDVSTKVDDDGVITIL